MNNPELHWIRSALSDRRASVVAERTGLSRKTVTDIRDGRVANPQIGTLTVLAAYLRGANADAGF
jgi:transcriptional regulator with XRE-family HTH domain